MRSTRPHISARKTPACNSDGICLGQKTNWRLTVPPYLTSKGRSGRACCITTTAARTSQSPHTRSSEANAPPPILTLTRKRQLFKRVACLTHRCYRVIFVFYLGTLMLSRINTSWVIPVERPLVAWLAARLPASIKPDHLTLIGFIGALVCGIAYGASWLSLDLLWVASAGLVINWFGDSLDGTLARFRKIERPRYGFFIDNT